MDEAQVCTKIQDTIKNGTVEERKKIASKTDIPESCMCRVAGYLLKDKNKEVTTTLKKNNTLYTECNLEQENTYQIEEWLDADAKKATVDCSQSTCDIPERITGELEAEGVDIISLKNTNTGENEILKKDNYIFAPEKLLWYKHTPHSIEEHLNEIKKGKYIKKQLKKLNKKNIDFIFDEKLTNPELIDKWYDLYEETVLKKERGKQRVDKEKLKHRSDLTGMYMMEDNELLAGILLEENKRAEQGRYNSAAYGAFSRKYPGISDVMYYKLIEKALEDGVDLTTLGMDTNFYGYHLSNGLYKFKTSHGFTVRPYRIRNSFHHLKILNPEKFENPFCFIETDYGKKKKAINNVFLRDDGRIRMENYHAKDGMKLYKNGELKKRTYFKPKHKDFFPDILDNEENILGI